jgi:hypothetical protein
MQSVSRPEGTVEVFKTKQGKNVASDQPSLRDSFICGDDPALKRRAIFSRTYGA